MIIKKKFIIFFNIKLIVILSIFSERFHISYLSQVFGKKELLTLLFLSLFCLCLEVLLQLFKMDFAAKLGLVKI